MPFIVCLNCGISTTMYISATALLVLGALLGATWGFLLDYPALKIAICCFAGGFAGSVAGGILFTFLYLTASDPGGDEDEQRQPLPDPGGGKTDAGVAKKRLRSVELPGKKSGTPTVQKTGAETDTMKIKRLEQEIRSIKNRSTRNKGRI